MFVLTTHVVSFFFFSFLQSGGVTTVILFPTQMFVWFHSFMKMNKMYRMHMKCETQ